MRQVARPLPPLLLRQGSPRPVGSTVPFRLPGLTGAQTPQTLPRRKRSTGTPSRLATTVPRTFATIASTAIPDARPRAVLGIAPQTAERVRGHTVAAPFGPSRGWFLWTKECIGVYRSGIARRGLGAARQIGRPLEAVGNGAKPDRLDAVLALVVGDLARSWTKRSRTRGPSSPNAAEVKRTSEESRDGGRRAQPAAERRLLGTDSGAPGRSRAWRTGHCMNMLLTARQLDRLRELPPSHKVLTARDGSPILERPDGRLWRVQPNGSLAPAPPVERVRSYLRVGDQRR